MCVLAIDIGGTGTKMACAGWHEGHLQLDNTREYASKEFASLNDIIRLYLEEVGHQCRFVSIAFAGPVNNNACRLTNLSWHVTRQSIAEDFSFENIFFLNDLEAQGYSVLVPSQIEMDLLVDRPLVAGNKAIIAPGTGLGEAFICHYDGSYHPFASEGGHCDFSPTNSEEMALLEFVKKSHKRVSWERIVSGGMGLLNIYEFFVETDRFQWDRQLDEAKGQGTKYFARELYRLADEGLLVANEVIKLYCGLLGAEAGNLALKVMSTGGIYLSGGVTRHIKPFLNDSPFYDRFIAKGRFKELLSDIPIWTVSDKNIGIKGAAIKALQTEYGNVY